MFECPYCNAILGFDEIQFQECDCCGWPNVDEEGEDDEDYDPDYDDYLIGQDIDYDE